MKPVLISKVKNIFMAIYIKISTLVDKTIF